MWYSLDLTIDRSIDRGYFSLADVDSVPEVVARVVCRDKESLQHAGIKLSGNCAVLVIDIIGTVNRVTLILKLIAFQITLFRWKGHILVVQVYTLVSSSSVSVAGVRPAPLLGTLENCENSNKPESNRFELQWITGRLAFGMNLD